MLSLLELTIGLRMWLFSTSVVPSTLNPIQTSPSFKSWHNESKVDPSPPSTISSPSSSTLCHEKFKCSNQKAKKKKKKKKKTNKKKLDKREENRVVIALNAFPLNRPSNPPRKIRFPCKPCKRNHHLRECPGILRVLEIWSQNLDLPSPSTYGDHVNVAPLVSDGKRNRKIRFPCRLCEGEHLLHLCPCMDKASKFLKTLQLLNPNFLLVIRGFLLSLS